MVRTKIMSKKEKLRRKIIESDSEISFEDLITFLCQNGFQMRQRGSHCIFTLNDIPDQLNIQSTAQGKVKRYQIKQVRDFFQRNRL